MGSEPLFGFITIFRIDSENMFFHTRPGFFAGFSFLFQKNEQNRSDLFKNRISFNFITSFLKAKPPFKSIFIKGREALPSLNCFNSLEK